MVLSFFKPPEAYLNDSPLFFTAANTISKSDLNKSKENSKDSPS